jgi:hypothetical protein
VGVSRSRALGWPLLGVGSVLALWLGGWAARAIHLWGIIGVVLVLVVLFVVSSMIFGVLRATPAVTITFWTACGLVLGAVTIAGEIGRRLQDEGRNRL